MELIEYPDREMMFMALANRLAGDLNSHLMRHEAASLAVPGGTTPGPIFDDLCDVDLDWDRVSVMLTDERWVPEDSHRSNTRLLKERLLVNKAAAARYVPLYGGTAEPEASIDALSGAVEELLPLTVVLLGMGEDMHTASLFPGADRLEEALSSKAPALMAMRGGGAAEPRITLTAPVLTGAMSLHLVITGKEKRNALLRAQEMTPSRAPVAAILGDAVVHWAE